MCMCLMIIMIMITNNTILIIITTIITTTIIRARLMKPSLVRETTKQHPVAKVLTGKCSVEV